MIMKAFNKWCKNNYNPDKDLTAFEDYKEGYKDGRKDGWIAALEWILLLGSDDDKLYVKIKKELYYG